MADETPDASRSGPGDTPKTPFDNPFFLPVMLWIFAVWFGYDGWLNTDAHMLEPKNLWFNRIGFPIVLVLAVWFTLRGLRERRAERERAAGEGRQP